MQDMQEKKGLFHSRDGMGMQYVQCTLGFCDGDCMICECCLADLTNKPNYATLLVNREGVVFTWIYCDVHCLANDWQSTTDSIVGMFEE